jgi:flagellar basal body-associated protein FliL
MPAGKKGFVICLSVVAAVVVLAIVGAAVFFVTQHSKAAKERDDESAARRQRAAIETQQVQARAVAQSQRQAQQLNDDAAQRNIEATRASESYEAKAAEEQKQELVKRQKLYDDMMRALGQTKGAAVDASESVQGLLAQVNLIRNCPNYLCNAQPSGNSEAFLIERWTNNTATTFIGSLGQIRLTSTGVATGVDVSPVNLDFNTSRLRVVGRCDGPFSAAGAAQPFIYTVQKTLFGAATINMRVSILAQLFDVAYVQQDLIPIYVTATAWTRTPDGSFRQRDDFFMLGSANTINTVVDNHGAGAAATTRGFRAFEVTAPFAATYLDIESITLTLQNGAGAANPDRILVNAGDVVRFDWSGLSSAVFVSGETWISRSAFSLAPGGEPDGVSRPSYCADASAAETAAEAGAAAISGGALQPVDPASIPGAENA